VLHALRPTRWQQARADAESGTRVCAESDAHAGARAETGIGGEQVRLCARRSDVLDALCSEVVGQEAANFRRVASCRTALGKTSSIAAYGHAMQGPQLTSAVTVSVAESNPRWSSHSDIPSPARTSKPSSAA
jgi:hypothetical protein